MPRKPSPITVADIEAAERAQVVAAALRRQQPDPPPLTAEQEQAARLFDRLDRRLTSEDVANEQAQARVEDVARRNAKGDAARRQYAATLRASGYQGWTGGDR
jgi:hypothetical protein